MTKLIQVSVSGDDITVDPTVAHFTHGAEMTWQAVGGDITALTITFTDGRAVQEQASGPFAGRTKLEFVIGFDKEKIGESLRAGQPGVYSYKVALATAKRIYVDVGCPSVVID